MQEITSRKLKILFFSFVGENYSRSSITLHGESLIYEKKFIQLPVGLLTSSRMILARIWEIKSADNLVVMSPCHIIAPILKLFTRKQVVLDAGWPLTDGQLSRGLSIRGGFKLFQTYLIDFIAFHSVDRLIVESEAQRIRTSRIFFIPKKKIEVNFTGLDESAFVGDTCTSGKIQELDKKLVKSGFHTTILFRGKINNESGIQNIVSAAVKLEKKATFILVSNKNNLLVKLPSNVIWLSELTNDELKSVYERSDIVLGQISNHPRLSYTIPHKAFEAGFFSKTYLTADTRGIRELYGPDAICVIDDISGSGLATEIEKLFDSSIRTEFARRIHLEYNEKASQKILSAKFERILQGL